MQQESATLTTPAAAAFINVSKRTLESWRARGIGPRYIALSARAVRYRVDDLRAFLDQRTVETGTNGAAAR
jgi:helix-turn-helix protein